MDRHLKERLVGAVVLVAAANILIPPMLDGSRDTIIPHTSADATSTDGAVKTYTIDLQAAKEPFRETAESAEELGVRNDGPAVESPSMPPNEMPETETEAEIEAVPESTAVAVTTPDKTSPSSAVLPSVAPSGGAPFGATPKPSPASATTAGQATNRVSDRTPPLNPRDSPLPSASDIASNPPNAKPTSEKLPQRTTAASAWAVQVASFSARATADRIVAELKAKGFPAFVVSFQSKGQTMYRVRIGPVSDRAAAETMLGKVKVLHASANIVAHP